MTEQGHTPEPWQYGNIPNWQPGRSNFHVVRPEGEFPHGLWIADFGFPGDTGEANAKRAVACVNALAGLNPDGVADLLEALQYAVNWAEGYAAANGDSPAFLSDARAALAKLEGRQNA